MDEKLNETTYIKGFNHGYFLKQEAPDLLEALLTTQSKNSLYLEGIQKGKDQYDLEFTKDKQDQEITDLFNTFKQGDMRFDMDQEKDLHRDHDIELDDD